LGSVTVIACGIAVFLVLWHRSGAHEVSSQEARRRFEQSSPSTQPANLTVLRFARPRGSGAQALVVNDVSHLGASAAVPWAYPADLTARPPHA
ncbi:MAG: hypothetical protein ACXWN5_09275, partial [Candidatus Limnocylindrales bacterium]